VLSFENLLSEYPVHLRQFDRAILREYLQYKILEIISDSDIGSKLFFIGGTAIRILYDSQRFSEDLDFDNVNLTDEEFYQAVNYIKERLELLGFEVDLDASKNKTIYHYKIRFPGIYHKYKLSGHKEETIMIKVDSEKQKFDYLPETKLLNKFEVLTSIKTPAKDVLLSMKMNAFFDREQGRDIYDIIFMSSKTKPNYDFLAEKHSITNSQQLKERLLERYSELDQVKMISRLKEFLFIDQGKKYIDLFPQFVKDQEF